MEPFYFHGTTIDGYRFTIAGKFNVSELTLGVSVCSSNDSFCRRKGRLIATGRMLQGKIHARGQIVFPTETRPGQEMNTFIQTASACNYLTRKELMEHFNL